MSDQEQVDKRHREAEQARRAAIAAADRSGPAERCTQMNELATHPIPKAPGK